MPLTKLQTFGREAMCLLYENPDIRTYRGLLHLKPGVAFFLRRFHTLIKSLVQDAWIRYIRSLNANQPLLGQVLDLQEFLFGTARNDLSAVKDLLQVVQEGFCFYCDGRIVSECGDVDHFVPWSRYSVDLGHNFVLAHSACNNSKREFLADVPHLEKWIFRNRTKNEQLLSHFQRANVVYDLNAGIHITRWAYEQAELSGASVWLLLHRFPFRMLSRDKEVLTSSPSPQRTIPGKRLYHSPSGTSGSLSSHPGVLVVKRGFFVFEYDRANAEKE